METIEIPKAEYLKMLEAYKTMSRVIMKFLPCEDIYTEDFLESLNDYDKELTEDNLKQVDSFDDFIN